MEYFETRPQLMQQMAEITPKMQMNCKTEAEYKVWARNARATLHMLLGFPYMKYADPQPRLIESVQLDGYTREKWHIHTEPGIVMPFYALMPDGIQPGEKRPAVICAHGHAACGKEAPAGNRLFPALENSIDVHHYDYGVQAVRKGAIAFCPDARGQGERREYDMQGDSEDARMAASCYYLNMMAYPLGKCVLGMWMWDLMRLVDYVTSREDVQADKIGCIGLSGGGMQTLYLAALDERIAYAGVSGYFYGFRTSLLNMKNCYCNYVPHMWENFEVSDIAALIAPRALIIETGTKDIYNAGPDHVAEGLNNVYPYVEKTREAYRLFGKEDMLYHDVFEGPHMWHGVKSIEGIEKHLVKGEFPW